MSRTLNWQSALLAKAQLLIEMRQYSTALAMLDRVAGSADFAGKSAIGLHRFTVVCCLELGRFKEARRRLRLLMVEEPNSASYHYAFAQAIERDPKMDAGRALRHYRVALKSEKDNVEWLIDAGQCAVSLGRESLGLKWLRRAVELAPESFEALEAYVESLCDIEKFDVAREAIQEGRFAIARSTDLERLRFQVEFRGLRASQSECVVDSPVVLPFLRVSHSESKSPRRKWRADSGTTSFHPHLPRLRRPRSTRNAP